MAGQARGEPRTLRSSAGNLAALGDYRLGGGGTWVSHQSNLDEASYFPAQKAGFRPDARNLTAPHKTEDPPGGSGRGGM